MSPYNDIDAIEAAIDADKNIVAILVEPVQGEGGVNIPASRLFKPDPRNLRPTPFIDDAG